MPVGFHFLDGISENAEAEPKQVSYFFKLVEHVQMLVCVLLPPAPR